MPFPYYERLTRRQQAIYRKSDALGDVILPRPDVVLPAVASIEAALAANDRAAVQKAARDLVRRILRQLGAPKLTVRVLAARPRSADEELHGLYEREEDEVPVLSVWMRTSAHRRVVAFRTFLRTLIHEVCHHLDYDLHGLEDSFHTEGFFRRESSLVRQLLGTGQGRRPRPRDRALERAPKKRSAPRRRSRSGDELEGTPKHPKGQLELPI